jgi:TonB family protein
MRAIWIGLGMALAVAAVAEAGSYQDNEAQGWIQPKAEAENARWPRDANGKLIFGKVTLDCGIDADGHASDCRAQSSDPTNPALEKAVQTLTPFYTAKDRGKTRRPLVLSLTYDTPPSWLHKPSPAFLGYAIPLSAWANPEGGAATIKCLVNKQGLAQDCQVLEEEPEGAGFGGAALSLAPTLLFKPATANGQPVEAEVSVPVNFRLGKSAPGVSYNTAPAGDYILSAPHWSKAPGSTQVSAQLDKKVGDKFADGKAVFMCSLNKTTGRLKACHVVNASEGMAQFKSVGNALIDDFQASPDTLSELKSWPDGANPLVFLPFSFPDMASASLRGRYLDHVQWTTSTGASPLFPEAAAAAGLKTGLATVDCLVKDTGALTECTVARESTPGVGFGELAKKIAETAAVNPWTEEGLPAGGARVRVPIRMDYTPPAGSPTPASKP